MYAVILSMYAAYKTQSDVCTATSDVCITTKYKVLGIINRSCVCVGLTKQPKFAVGEFDVSHSASFSKFNNILFGYFDPENIIVKVM